MFGVGKEKAVQYKNVREKTSKERPELLERLNLQRYVDFIKLYRIQTISNFYRTFLHFGFAKPYIIIKLLDEPVLLCYLKD